MSLVAILGCTGSIGSTTFNVIEGLRRQDGDEAWRVAVLTAGSRVDELIVLAQRWRPHLVCVANEGAADSVRRKPPLKNPGLSESLHRLPRPTSGRQRLPGAPSDTDLEKFRPRDADSQATPPRSRRYRWRRRTPRRSFLQGRRKISEYGGTNISIVTLKRRKWPNSPSEAKLPGGQKS